MGDVGVATLSQLSALSCQLILNNTRKFSTFKTA